ncbi:hypothetical protein EV424DRAFT_1416209 [Suillus variegatus]|nr:hypothetical protein EV424DRAFT_1416209 [Suillus variegatus]
MSYISGLLVLRAHHLDATAASSIPTTCCVLPYQENHDPSLVHITSPILSLRDPDCGCLRDTMLKCVLFRGSSHIACLQYACNTM